MSILQEHQVGANSLSRALVWFHFLPSFSLEGAQWNCEFHRSGAEDLARRLDTAVLESRIDQTRSLDTLNSARLQILALHHRVQPSITKVLTEGYFSALAYSAFHMRRFAAALAALDHASRTVHSTVGMAPYLTIYAIRILKIETNRLRVLRESHDYGQLSMNLNNLHLMVRGEVPLLFTGDKSIFMADIYDLLEMAAPRNNIESQALALLRNRTENIARYEAETLRAAICPDWAGIQY